VRYPFNLIALAALAGVLTACGTADIEGMQVKGPAFNKGLYDGYLSLAKSEYDEDDWPDGAKFGDRAVASAEGSPPGPEAIAARKLPKRTVAELTSARGKLVSALSRGAAGKDPANAALAQVMFDCWMQEQEEDLQPDHIANCRTQFEKAMARVDAALGKKVAKAKPKKVRKPQTTKYVVYFDFNSVKLSRNARTVIDMVKGEASKGAKVSVTGFTDRAGAAAYNNVLATKRSKAVRSALIKAGIKSAIKSAAYGEEKNAVATKDGVRELLNRRVEISVKR
jgi:outer membrane protein OmpA-like peptidoglycan-associated protein